MDREMSGYAEQPHLSLQRRSAILSQSARVKLFLQPQPKHGAIRSRDVWENIVAVLQDSDNEINVEDPQRSVEQSQDPPRAELFCFGGSLQASLLHNAEFGNHRLGRITGIGEQTCRTDIGDRSLGRLPELLNRSISEQQLTAVEPRSFPKLAPMAPQRTRERVRLSSTRRLVDAT